MSLPQVVYSLAELGEGATKPIWLAIGMFDGVHRGHLEVIGLALEEARKENGVATVLTFPEHPGKLLRPGQEPPLLMDATSKVRILIELGIDRVVMRPFDSAFSKVSANDFLDLLQGDLPALRGVCVGENFRFGKGRTGDADLLRENGLVVGLEVRVAPSALHGGVPVSSSRIRLALGAGDIETVGAMLGRPYQAVGTIIGGRGLGTEIGFPTLNLRWFPEARPAHGVYLAGVSFGDSSVAMPAVANFGVRPTVEEGAPEPLLEAHLLGDGDEGADLAELGPGQAVSVDLLRFLRAERKFDSLEELKVQIAADKETAKAFFAERGLPAG